MGSRANRVRITTGIIITPESQKVEGTPTRGSRAVMARPPAVNRKDPTLRSRP